ncbi:MAG TPA: sensor domain-containing diguanylate cyclase [Acidimicrobiales bacterium]|nr:sensor domain-containing diguanylate cyclase [Acidimicrobiales bacterium]
MIRPSIPKDEDERLAALRRLALLDTEPDEAFERIARIARRLFGVRWCFVTLLDEDRQWFKTHHGASVSGTTREISFSGHVVAADGLLVVEDARADERFFDNPLVVDSQTVVFYAGIPIRSPDGYAVGVFCIVHDDVRRLEADEVHDLEDLAAVVEREIATHYRACLDEVTGVYNRRGFIAIGRNALARAAQRGTPLSLAYVDVDGLKTVNDAHGHTMGDHALLAVAQALRSTTRASDVIGRLGGDEFSLLLFDCTVAGTEPILSALEERFADELQAISPGLHVGLSAGAADAQPGLSLEDLIHLADARMYERKLAKPR